METLYSSHLVASVPLDISDLETLLVKSASKIVIPVQQAQIVEIAMISTFLMVLLVHFVPRTV